LRITFRDSHIERRILRLARKRTPGVDVIRTDEQAAWTEIVAGQELHHLWAVFPPMSARRTIYLEDWSAVYLDQRARRNRWVRIPVGSRGARDFRMLVSIRRNTSEAYQSTGQQYPARQPRENI